MQRPARDVVVRYRRSSSVATKNKSLAASDRSRPAVGIGRMGGFAAVNFNQNFVQKVRLDECDLRGFAEATKYSIGGGACMTSNKIARLFGAATVFAAAAGVSTA